MTNALALLKKEHAILIAKADAVQRAIVVLDGEPSKQARPAKKTARRTRRVVRASKKPRRDTILEAVSCLTEPVPKKDFIRLVAGRSGSKERNRWNVAVYSAASDGKLVIRDGMVAPLSQTQ